MLGSLPTPAVGRTHPLVAAVADEVLSRAFAAEADQAFARAGAIYTNAVDLRTILLLLRIRYLLREQIQADTEPVESFAEEIVLAACQRDDGGLRWLEPIDRAGRALADARSRPRTCHRRKSGISSPGRWISSNSDRAWFRPVVDHRVAALVEAHQRLRKLMAGAEARDPSPRAARHHGLLRTRPDGRAH